MRTKLLTLIFLLAFMRCCQSCRQKKCVRLECLAHTSPLIKHMIDTIKAMRNSIPDEEPHKKLLKNFHKPCKKKGVDLPVISDILDIYMTHVFSKLDNSQTLVDNVSRLQDTLEHCLDRNLHQNLNCKSEMTRRQTAKNMKKIKDLRTVFRKLEQRDLYKAVLEFKTVLIWIGMFID